MPSLPCGCLGTANTAHNTQHGADFSTGLTYSLLQLSDRSGSDKPEDAIWRSQLHYRLARFFRDKVKGGEDAKDRREKLLNDAIKEVGGALEAFIKMLNAKVAYAKGRKLVDDQFETWFRDCIKATELRRIEIAVAEHEQFFLEKWHEFFRR